jgi:uncharacterized oxidoreductase
MKINDNTILITGGATGIGFALAEAFVKEDNEVIICGRREHKLKEAKTKLPQIHTKVCDLSKGKERALGQYSPTSLANEVLCHPKSRYSQFF